MMKKLNIKTISTESYQTLIKDAEVIEKDTLAAKVLKLNNGSFFKLFRRKRWFSSELVYPYVRRFADNSVYLRKLAIATPNITQLYRFNLGDLAFTGVQYVPLPGVTLRVAMQDAEDKKHNKLIKLFGELLAKLHQHGVYFRSIHLGNVLLLPDGQLGLIDFADMTKQTRPLSQSKRARNLKHIQRYPEDANWLFNEYFDDFCDGYKRVAGDIASRFLTNK